MIIDTNDLMLFILTVLGSLFGVNFGGSMLLVMPTLLGFGYTPLIVLSSTRPAIVLQSLLGAFMFKKHKDINYYKQAILFFSAALGALVGIYFLAQLNKDQAIMLMLSLMITLSILASLKYVIINFLNRKNSKRPSSNEAYFKYFICGFFPAIIGGLVGSGAGLIVVLFSFLLLKKNALSTSFLEKFVSLGHSLTVLIWSFFYGEFDLKISLIVLGGTFIGAYLGARITLKLNNYWMYFVIILLCLIIILKNYFL